MKVLIIADTHISPSTTNCIQFYKLGEYCVKYKPEAIIHLGDVANLDSLNNLICERGLYTTDEEVNFVNECIESLNTPIDLYNLRMRKNKKKLYRPKKYLCLGNHDVRKKNNKIKNLFIKQGWIVIDYLKPLIIDNILFTHCVKFINSECIANTPNDILSITHASTVVGHSHRFSYESGFRYSDNKKIFCIKAPMYSDETPQYAEGSYQNWDRGFIILDTISNKFEWVNML